MAEGGDAPEERPFDKYFGHGGFCRDSSQHNFLLPESEPSSNLVSLYGSPEENNSGSRESLLREHIYINRVLPEPSPLSQAYSGYGSINVEPTGEFDPSVYHSRSNYLVPIMKATCVVVLMLLLASTSLFYGYKIYMQYTLAELMEVIKANEYYIVLVYGLTTICGFVFGITVAPRPYNQLKQCPTDGISRARFAPNSPQFLLCSSWDASLRLYDVQANTLRVNFLSGGPLLDWTFQDPIHVWSGGLEGQLRTADINSNTETIVLARQRHQPPSRYRISRNKVGAKVVKERQMDRKFIFKETLGHIN
eukprot:maker-scaffold126_size328755-snap-gene-1.16 protein:Tk06900 transcript:maker-scaffold126_size328755-snap-gene-1.16-mRNA-1 annotation:"mitotic checkpoint protein bub3"